MKEQKYMVIFLVNDYGCIYPEYEIMNVDDIFCKYDFETLIKLGDEIEITECIESDENRYERIPMTIVRIK